MNQTDNLYEAIIIFAPTLTPQEAQAELESIDDKVRSRGITIQQTVAPFKKKLPYTVRHFSNGYFCAVTFTAEKDPMQIVHILKNSKNILRIGIGQHQGYCASAIVRFIHAQCSGNKPKCGASKRCSGSTARYTSHSHFCNTGRNYSGRKAHR